MHLMIFLTGFIAGPFTWNWIANKWNGIANKKTSLTCILAAIFAVVVWYSGNYIFQDGDIMSFDQRNITTTCKRLQSFHFQIRIGRNSINFVDVYSTTSLITRDNYYKGFDEDQMGLPNYYLEGGNFIPFDGITPMEDRFVVVSGAVVSGKTFLLKRIYNSLCNQSAIFFYRAFSTSKRFEYKGHVYSKYDE